MTIFTSIRRFRRKALYTGITLCMLCVLNGNEKQRPFRSDDIFQLDQVGFASDLNCSLTTDGSAFAFIVTPHGTEKNFLANVPLDRSGSAGTEVWVQLKGKGRPILALPDGKDETSWSEVRWSPSGMRLASIRKGYDYSHLWIWDRATSKPRQVTNLKVESFSYKWIDDSRIAVILTPEGRREVYHAGIPDAMRKLPSAWDNAQRGIASSVTVLSTGAKGSNGLPKDYQLAVIDVTDDSVQCAIACTFVQEFSISPSGQSIALLQRDTFTSSGKYLPEGRTSIEVWDLNGKRCYPSADRTAYMLGKTVRWSPDGAEVAFIASSPGSAGTEKFDLHRVQTLEGTDRISDLSEFEMPEDRLGIGLEWTQKGDLLLFAAKKSPLHRAAGFQDWWLLQDTAVPIAITGSMLKIPENIVRLPDEHSFAGLVGGDVWRFSTSGEAPTNLTRGQLNWTSIRIAQPRFSGWASRWNATSQPFSKMLLAGSSGADALNIAEVDLISGTVSKIDPPAAFYRLVQFCEANDDSIYFGKDRTGSYLVWRNGATKECQIVLHFNAWLKNVASAEIREFEYCGAGNEHLSALLLLPIGYQRGKKYPVVCWVYPRQIINADTREKYKANSAISDYDPRNLQILAAQGYAVLIPSLPMKHSNSYYDILESKDDLFPAINQLIDEGVCDPERLFVAGQSGGGHLTYLLITATERFKAAVGMAGFSNLVGTYGNYLNSRLQYESDPAFTTGGGNTMNLAEKIRNSPALNADRIQTPVLIVQGEFDYVPFGQGEELFVALSKLNKRADFARYWGEGHMLMSPANIRDCWSRIFAWFDDFGDIQRDAKGELVWDGDHVKSRNGAPALQPAEFLKLERFFDPSFGIPESGLPNGRPKSNSAVQESRKMTGTVKP